MATYQSPIRRNSGGAYADLGLQSWPHAGHNTSNGIRFIRSDAKPMNGRVALSGILKRSESVSTGHNDERQIRARKVNGKASVFDSAAHIPHAHEASRSVPSIRLRIVNLFTSIFRQLNPSRRMRRRPHSVIAGEVLESRALLTSIPLTDIGMGSGAEIQEFTEINGTGYFIASAAGQPDNLWLTDGTAAGTMPVTTFTSAEIDHLTRVNDMLYFSLRHGNSQTAEGLWKSDGTPQGTTHVREFVAISDMINNDGVLYFGGRDYRGTELWKSDGTFAGTELVKEITPGPDGSDVSGLQIFQQQVVFSAAIGSTSDQSNLQRLGLWISDGTEVGTHELFGFETLGLSIEDSVLATPDGIFAENFTQDDTYLWISNGSPNATPLIVDPEPTPGRDINAENLTWFDGRVFFSRNNMEGLWITDLATADTTILELDVTVEDMIATDTGVYFVGNDPVNGREIWQTDGTFDGTQRLTNFQTPEGANVVPDYLRTDGVRVYFLADLQFNTAARGDNYSLYQMQPNADDTHTFIKLNTTASQPTDNTVFPQPPAFDQLFQPFDGRFLYVDDNASDLENLWSVSAEITASPADNPLKFLTPNDRIRQQYPEFSWSSIRGAASYELWVALNGETTPVIDETVGSTTYISNQPLAPGRYTAWVRVTFSDGMVGDWQPQPFRVAKAPRLHHPTSPTDNVRPVISWDPIPGATGYRVFVNNSTTQQNPVIDTTVTGTSFTPGIDFSMGRHRVWVAALGTANFQGDWSDPILIDVAPAASLSPWATTDLRPQFSWSAVPGATEYQIYISGAGGFRIVESGISGTTFTPGTDLPAGSYRWWVRAVTSAQRSGPWSAQNDLYTGGLTRAQIVTRHGDNTPTLTWPEIPGATAYEVYVTNLDQHNSFIYRQPALTSTTFTTIPLPDSDPRWDYRVWIRTTLADGRQQWGLATDFSIHSVHAGSFDDGPTQLGTTRTTFDGLPEFIWEGEPDDGEYEIFLHTPEEQIHFEDVQATPDGEGRLFWTPPAPLAAHAHDWKMFIRYIDELGQPGGWARGEDFHSGGRTRVVSTSIFEAFPPLTLFDTVTINWVQVREATGYEIYLTNLTTGDRGVVQERTGPSGTWVSSAELPPGQYRVWVRAIANTIPGPWSLPYDFEVQAA